MRTAVLLVSAALISSGMVLGQASQAARGLSRTDVALSLYGAFNESTSGNDTAQSPSNSAGGLIEVRHIRNPIIGYEATYAFNRANQRYAPLSPLPCPPNPTTCGVPAAVLANAHEITGDWIASVKIANLRPFALAGVGLLLDVPRSGQTDSLTSTKPVFVYGGGLDWGLLPHLGLRFQYRGNLYKAPDLTTLYTSSGAFTHTAEPMIGAYLRF
jgi:opacity protein-like surface antigen